jgi:hypothetical protein
MAESELKKWLRNAMPGDNFTYYVGETPTFKRATPVFVEARQQERLEVVVLKQRRLSVGIYEYIAERVSRKTVKAINTLNVQLSDQETLQRAVKRRAITA